MVAARKDQDGDWTVYTELTVDRYDLEGEINTVKAWLDQVRDQAVAMGMKGEGSLDIRTTEGYYGSTEVEVVYFFNRLETDSEKAKREAQEAKRKAEAKAKRKAAAEKRKQMSDPEFAEYERLKSKFG
jgi:hypothetical protein